jgi:large subunit ribosomal protein L30
MTKSSTSKLKITQSSSSIGRKQDQRQTLIGLGLNKMHKTRILIDTKEVRGMLYKVRHLVKVEEL